MQKFFRTSGKEAPWSAVLLPVPDDQVRQHHRIQHTPLHCDVCRLTDTLTTNQSSFRNHQALHVDARDGKDAKLDFGRVLGASV